jgi:hypothetical protein
MIPAPFFTAGGATVLATAAADADSAWDCNIIIIIIINHQSSSSIINHQS